MSMPLPWRADMHGDHWDGRPPPRATHAGSLGQSKRASGFGYPPSIGSGGETAIARTRTSSPQINRSIDPRRAWQAAICSQHRAGARAGRSHHSSSIDVEPKWASAASIVRIPQLSRQLSTPSLRRTASCNRLPGVYMFICAYARHYHINVT